MYCCWRVTMVTYENKENFCQYIILHLVFILVLILYCDGSLMGWLAHISNAPFILQRFILKFIEWRVVPATYSKLPKFEVFSDVGRFQRMSPYYYHSVPPPPIPAMHGTFVIIRLLQAGEHIEVPFFTINYLVLNTRPSPAQDGKPGRLSL